MLPPGRTLRGHIDTFISITLTEISMFKRLSEKIDLELKISVILGLSDKNL